MLACLYHLREHKLVSCTYSEGSKGSVHRTETIGIKPAEGWGRGWKAIFYRAGKMQQEMKD